MPFYAYDYSRKYCFGLKISKKPKHILMIRLSTHQNLLILEGYETVCLIHFQEGSSRGLPLVRAIVNEPKVLLLDEPLGALDLKLRQDIQYELKRLKMNWELHLYM